MFRVTRRFSFEAAHRLPLHPGQCKHLHGHTYVVDVTLESEKLNDQGMVLDFGVLKTGIGDWLDIFWDHATILADDDSLAEDIKEEGRKPAFLMKGQPTAERMSKFLFAKCCQLLPNDIKVANVRVYETPNSWADYYSMYQE